MEGCKIGHIEPCSEEMAQGIIEALRKLRNASELEEVSNRLAEHIFEDILKSIKSNDMEEKKTKKMTKAEAFEYLKGKKVKCYKAGEHYGEELLKKLTECGCTSNIFLPKGILSVWAIFISDACDLSILDTAHADQYGNYDLCEISADDILSIEIIEEEEEEDTSMPTVEFERYVKILQAWSKRINSSFVFSERGMGIIRGDLLTKLEGEEKGAYYKVEATL